MAEWPSDDGTSKGKNHLGKRANPFWLALLTGSVFTSSHLQQPRGPADASRLLSVSEARVGSVDIEDMSLTDGEDDGC